MRCSAVRAGGRGEKIFLKDLFSYLHPFRTNQVTARWKKQAADYVFFHEQGWGFFPSFFLVLSLQRLLSAQFWCVCVCVLCAGHFSSNWPSPPWQQQGGGKEYRRWKHKTASGFACKVKGGGEEPAWYKECQWPRRRRKTTGWLAFWKMGIMFMSIPPK